MPSLLKKIIYLLPKGDPIKLIVLFMCMMIAAALEVAGIGMIPAFVSIIADPDKVLDYEPLVEVYSTFGVSSSEDLLIWGSVILVGVFLIKSAYIMAFNFFEARFIYNRRYTISHRLMSAYMHAPYTFHLQRNTAELLRNITQEVGILVNVVVVNSLTLAREGIMAISIFLFLLYVEPLITLLVFCMAGLGSGVFLMLTRKKFKQLGKQEQGHRRNMIMAVNQGMGGIKEARVLNREAEFIEKFRTEARESSSLLAYIRFVQQIPKPVIETTAVVGMMLIAAILVWQGRPMTSIIPVLTLFAMAIVRLMPAVQSMTTMYSNLVYNAVAIDPIYQDLKLLEKHNKDFLTDRKKDHSSRLESQIEAKNVSFHYPESDEQALKKVSFSIDRGSAVAFVGESGAGKTTIVDLLLGLLVPSDGVIFADQKNIQENLSAWQKNVGYIPQSIYLGDETLRRNIAFGLSDKDIDDEKVMKAVELARLKDLVERLPKGLDTITGEHGTRLSGGQRQRVGIARALYHQPQILVMDEATSALDNITEKQITRAIDELKGDRTIVMIAHRLTTVQNCDLIYLMKNGEIIDRGTYDELVSQNEEFRKMALIQ